MEKIEMRDLLTYRFLSGVAAAPQGERAAFLVKTAQEEKNDYVSAIYLYEEGKLRRMTAEGKNGAPFWEDETHILFPAMREEKDRERAKNGENFTVFYRLDIRGGEAERAFEIPVSCGSMKRLGEHLWYFITSADRENPEEYAMSKDEKKALAEKRKEEEDYHVLTDSAYRFNGGGFQEGTFSALFVWNDLTGELKRITQPEEDAEFAEAEGDTLLFGTSLHRTTANFFSQLYRYDPKTGARETLYGENDFGINGAFPLGGKLVVLASDYRDAGLNQNSRFYLLENGKLNLLVDPDVGFGSSVGSDCRLGGGKVFRIYGGALYFTCTVGEGTQLKKLEPDGTVTIINRCPGSLDCFDITGKGTVLGVGLFGMKLQEMYEIGRGKKVTALTGLNTAALEGKYIAQPQPLSVRSQGKKIVGWVLLPRDYDPEKRYPAILDIHGGPKTVYGEVFYHEMQVWASRGYFVFFCNPTGSDGRGNAFMDIRGKYGTVDYRNLMDFTDEVLAQYPQIDPRRLAVTGGSYGGFMTNWIIGHTDRFACAATQRSISNWISFYGVSDIGIYFSKDQTAGDVLYNPEKMWRHSPLKYVKNCTTPTLFIHSDEDYRCPIDQGLQLYAALLDKGVDTRFVWFKGENHDLSRSGKPKHRLRRLSEITDWIEKYTN